MADETNPSAPSSPEPPTTDEGAALTESKEQRAAEERERRAEEGHPDPLAQIHLTNGGGTLSLRAALDSLPAIPALDGIKANWDTYSRAELVSALESLPLPSENVEALATRDALVRRLESGELRR